MPHRSPRFACFNRFSFAVLAVAAYSCNDSSPAETAAAGTGAVAAGKTGSQTPATSASGGSARPRSSCDCRAFSSRVFSFWSGSSDGSG